MDNFYTVRAFYRKEGRLKYISHLDLNRCVTRELKRSGLPVWHTLGFNPHIYVTFALPLSLGQESVCESFDFRLTEKMDLETAKERLNAVLPDGLLVMELALPVEKPETIAWADYDVSQEYAGDAKPVAERFARWLEQPEIHAVKKTKKGEKDVDLKPHFRLLHMESSENMLKISLRCAAGGTFNLNPCLVLERFAAAEGLPPDWQRIIRRAVLNKEMASWR